MRHLKLYEELNIDEPERGDYVIAECTKNVSNKKMIDFVNNTIGILINAEYDHLIGTFEYTVKYDDIPEEISEYYFSISGTKCFYELKYWSKSKEELMSIIAARKYNL